MVNESPAVADELSLGTLHPGVVVSEVEDGSAAAATGLQKGDVIIGIGNSRIATTRQMERATAARQDFWHVTLERDGQVIESEVSG